MISALYCRVSTAEQANEGYSIHEQEERLKSYCSALKIDSYKVYSDPAYSGGNTNRPALQQLIADVKAGKVNKVIVYKLDRLSRSQLDTLYLIEKVFLANNCDFISVSENFDTGSPFGRAIIGILAVFAQLEREQIKERLLMGRTARAKEGYFHGGSGGAIGYEYINGNLVINHYEAMQIKEAFTLYCTGYNFTDIRKLFDQKGYRTRFGSWNDKRIREVILNDLYIGKITFSGKKYDGKHTPIIDPETFKTAQAIHKAHYKEHVYNRQSPTNRFNYLGGLIYCGFCGAKFCCNYRAGGKYAYYTCYSRRKINKAMVKDPDCKNKIWRADKLNELILDEVMKLKLDPDQLKEAKTEDKRPAIQSQLDKLMLKRSKLIDLYSSDRITLEDFDLKIESLNDQIDKLNEQLLEAHTADLSQIKRSIDTFKALKEKSTVNELRSVLQILIDKIIIKNEDVEIHWNF